MTGLIIGIVTFMVLVIIHELGHFISAKKSGVRVDEFGIGIPPKATKIGKDKSGTIYTLNRIPLGGFVKLKGEDPKEPEEFNAKDSFIKAPLLNKILILISGVGMNFLLAYVIFVAIFTIGMKPISIIPDNAVATESRSYLMPTVGFLAEQNLLSGSVSHEPAIIQEVSDESLGSTLGLQSGDKLTYVNDTAINSWNIGMLLREQIGKEFTLKYERNGKEENKMLTCPEDQCLLGVMIASSTMLDVNEIKFPFSRSLIIAFHEIRAEIKLTLNVLGNFGSALFSFNGERIGGVVNRLTGPAGAIKFGDLLLKHRGRVAYLSFVGLLSLALAIFNILPIPALDGGRLLGVLIQGIGKLKPEKYFTIEGYINLVFFVLLMGLGVYILVKDLIVFWGINIPFLS